MNYPIPSFIPVPGAETMQIISIVSLIVGICITVVGVLFLFLNKSLFKIWRNARQARIFSQGKAI